MEAPTIRKEVDATTTDVRAATETAAVLTAQSGEPKINASSTPDGESELKRKASELEESANNPAGNVASTSTSDPPAEVKISKNQLKRMKRDAQWDAKRGERIEKRKRKLREKKARDAAEKQKLLEQGVAPPPRKPTVQKDPSKFLKQRVAIDLDFDKYHQLNDIKKLVSQVMRCYASNRRSEHPLQLLLTSLHGRVRERFDVLNGKNWKIETHEETYDKVFAKEDIVYLSSESENDLNVLDDSKVYIIGGLVDHNNQKGLTHAMALEKGLNHAKLPISKFLNIADRKVLTVNHVFEIMHHFAVNGDWKKAFLSAIPGRKGITELEPDEQNDGEDEDEDEQEGKGKEKATEKETETETKGPGEEVTEVCRDFRNTGKCKYGDKCKFVHVPHEPTAQTEEPKKVDATKEETSAM
eukprot:m.151515 g.151515  ORF g.151515 m.151515 type:complete len:413 (-) comp30765_c0_seq1:72-1310(-)